MVNNIHISYVPYTKDFTARLTSLQLLLRVPGRESYTLMLWLQKSTAQHAMSIQVSYLAHTVSG